MAVTRLPSYTVERAGAFYWQLPTWAKPPAMRNGVPCPVGSAALGRDKGAAITKAEALNEALKEWRVGMDLAPKKGTIIWLFDWYRQQDRFTSKSRKTRSDYKKLMDMLVDFETKAGQPKLGRQMAAKVDATVADKLYKKLRAKGERQATYAMQVCRLVWSWAVRHTNATGVTSNPFMGMGLKSTAKKGNRATSRAEYDLYRETARKMGFQSMATAAALSFECCQRTGDAFCYADPEDDRADDPAGFRWAGYHPGDRIELRQGKTDNRVRLPLVVEADAEHGPVTMLLYPDLMWELARSRVAAPAGASEIILEERSGKPYAERRMSTVHRKICEKAGLPKDMTFTGFRHGGITEVGAVDADVRPISGHSTLDVTRIYNKATMEKAQAIALERRRRIAASDA